MKARYNHKKYLTVKLSKTSKGLIPMSLLKGIKDSNASLSNWATLIINHWKAYEGSTDYSAMKVKVKITQLCLTLCDPMDYTVHGILQARILEWAAFPFSGDLPNLGIEPRSPSLEADFYQLSHNGSPRILEWIAYPFSSRSSQQGSN